MNAKLEQLLKQERVKAFRLWAGDPAVWRSTAGTNRHIGKMLYDRYLKAHKDYVEWMESSMKPGSRNIKISNEAISDMALGKSTLMFYGLALECSLKEYIISQGFDPIQNAATDNPSLNPRFLHHDLWLYTKQAFGSKVPAQIMKNMPSLKRLTRAITAGKYPVEKNTNETWAYTADLDKTIEFADYFMSYLKR